MTSYLLKVTPLPAKMQHRSEFAQIKLDVLRVQQLVRVVARRMHVTPVSTATMRQTEARHCPSPPAVSPCPYCCSQHVATTCS